MSLFLKTKVKDCFYFVSMTGYIGNWVYLIMKNYEIYKAIICKDTYMGKTTIYWIIKLVQ